MEVQQGDTTVSVRVVFDRCDGGRNAILITVEVNNSVPLLMTAALMASRLASVVVTTTGLGLLGQQRPLWFGAGDLGKVGHGLETGALDSLAYVLEFP